MQNKNYQYFIYSLLYLLLCSCSSSRPGLSSKKTPHEQYEKKIKDGGKKETPLNEAWLKEAAITLSNPLDISLPYSETGYFPTNRANGIGLRFTAKGGQKINISLTKKTNENLAVYVDLWQPSEIRSPRFLLAADTTNLSLEYLVNEDSAFIVRIQPELLKQGEYTLSISAGPSLVFPIPQNIKSSIISLFGTGRDNGGRKHEGIDILAPKHSPAVASANGIVTRVNENALGGKVIFLKPDNASYSLYYAHLDSQIAKEGQHVKTGDIIGLTGNTGNAQFTVSHLHFGIYLNNNVAIDPLYFVKAEYKEPAKISAPLNNLNTWMRSVKIAKFYYDEIASGPNFILLDENTLMRPEAASGNLYRVVLPDGKKGFVTAISITSASKPLKRFTIKKSLSLLSNPDASGTQKKLIAQGEKINVFASFNDYYFVTDKESTEGWVLKKQL